MRRSSKRTGKENRLLAPHSAEASAMPSTKPAWRPTSRQRGEATPSAAAPVAPLVPRRRRARRVKSRRARSTADSSAFTRHDPAAPAVRRSVGGHEISNWRDFELAPVGVAEELASDALFRGGWQIPARPGAVM